ncbi:carboxypeptidase-like regulatory domain-containing protein [Aeromicrobium sp. IC_218]|uniref:carboxypeptidase-like regulatory domain-containing protein n=1 Tax=Aeromicrobium sp. IC_218 TaxID=2545468 RepID=UPI00103A55EC|nr:carboxypeptidase-like regulatory domain-containing protein [Aeromicrobium sp. IC_218]TCI99175.1 carboxypeptidase regulatory-like domain-containing protein [Aeromicrobium sp. IC_218]
MRRPFLALTVLLALVFGVLAGPATTATATAADSTGSISGTVTYPDGDVTTVQVRVLGPAGARWLTLATVRPDADGRWRHAGLAPGRYRLGYVTTSDVVGTFYRTTAGTVSDVTAASTLTVAAGSDLSADVTVPLGGALKVTHVHPDDEAPSALVVMSRSDDGTWNPIRTVTAGSASTTVAGLEAGTYRLGVRRKPSSTGVSSPDLFWTRDGLVADVADGDDLEVVPGEVLDVPVSPLTPHDLVQPLVRPTVVGLAQPGGTLTATGERWPADVRVVDRQWYRAAGSSPATAVPIPGRTGTVLPVTPDLVGYHAFLVTTLGAPGRDRTTHWTTGQPITQPFASVPRLTVTAPRVGTDTRAVLSGAWSSPPALVTYRWTVDGVLKGFSPSFTPAPDQIAKTLHLEVTAIDSSFRSATLRAKTLVSGGRRGLRQLPALRNVRVGLVAQLAEDSSGTFEWVRGAEKARRTFEWLLDGKVVRGAAGRQYLVPPAAAHRRLTVRVTESLPGYDVAVATTNAVVVPRGSFVRPWRPYIAGRFSPGRVIRAGANVHPAPTGFRYRWYLDGKPIRGATGKRLRITKAMKNRDLRVAVTPMRPGYEVRAVRSRRIRVDGGGWWP